METRIEITVAKVNDDILTAEKAREVALTKSALPLISGIEKDIISSCNEGHFTSSWFKTPAESVVKFFVQTHFKKLGFTITEISNGDKFFLSWR